MMLYTSEGAWPSKQVVVLISVLRFETDVCHFDISAYGTPSTRNRSADKAKLEESPRPHDFDQGDREETIGYIRLLIEVRIRAI